MSADPVALALQRVKDGWHMAPRDAVYDDACILAEEVRRLEASDAANERRWRNEKAAKHQIMGYRDEERARADALQARLAALIAPAEGVDIEEVLGAVWWCPLCASQLDPVEVTHLETCAHCDTPVSRGDGHALYFATREVARLRAALATAERERDELRLTLAAEQDLLRRAFRTIHVGRSRAPLWVHVREVFMHGSTVSQDLCRRMGYDPDQEVGGKRAAERYAAQARG